MQLHQLQRDTPNKKHVQVGRGGTRGKTSGRGTKGQNARAGHRKRPEIRDIIKKIPKLRGHGKNRGKSNFLKPLVLPVNLTTLEAVFAAGDTVNPTTLMQMGVISKTRLGTSSVKTSKKFSFGLSGANIIFTFIVEFPLTIPSDGITENTDRPFLF